MLEFWQQFKFTFHPEISNSSTEASYPRKVKWIKWDILPILKEFRKKVESTNERFRPAEQQSNDDLKNSIYLIITSHQDFSNKLLTILNNSLTSRLLSKNKDPQNTMLFQPNPNGNNNYLDIYYYNTPLFEIKTKTLQISEETFFQE